MACKTFLSYMHRLNLLYVIFHHVRLNIVEVRSVRLKNSVLHLPFWNRFIELWACSIFFIPVYTYPFGKSLWIGTAAKKTVGHIKNWNWPVAKLSPGALTVHCSDIDYNSSFSNDERWSTIFLNSNKVSK